MAVPKGGGHYMIGDPYRVAGKTYIPTDNPRYAEVGLASWYGSAFHGRLTANGEVYDVNGLTAAHPTLPLPSYVRVTNLENGRSMTVRVNDRGPFAHDRIIDVSERVADMLGFRQEGTARVKVQYIGPAQLDGLDTKKLLASYHAPAFGAPVIQVAAAPAGRANRTWLPRRRRRARCRTGCPTTPSRRPRRRSPTRWCSPRPTRRCRRWRPPIRWRR